MAIKTFTEEASLLASKLLARADGSDKEVHPTRDVEAETFAASGLKGCLSVGHTNTDTDSIGSAIGAAFLFDGVATRSEKDVNGEIEYACKFAGCELPVYFLEVEGALDPLDGRPICLVDHNEPSQMVKELKDLAFPEPGVTSTSEKRSATQQMLGRIRGCIDHHALSKGFSTVVPAFLDVRPWGSACSIVAHQFVRLGRRIPTEVARILLCGILSDTVNLTSPTTTNADRLLCTLLTHLGGVDHPNQLAIELFKAKTAYFSKLSAFAIVRADQKDFNFENNIRIGWATVEVNDPKSVMAKSDKLLIELRILKKEKKLDFAFLTIVDLVKMQSDLLCCGWREVELAKEAFGGPTRAPVPLEKLDNFVSLCMKDEYGSIINHDFKLEEACMSIGNRTSRKKQFIPPVRKLLNSGWKPSEDKVNSVKLEKMLTPIIETTHSCDQRGCILVRKFSRPLMSKIEVKFLMGACPPCR